MSSPTSRTATPALPDHCPAASLWLIMMKSYRSMQLYVETTLADRRMGLSDFMILEALLHKGSMSMSRLGDAVVLANPSMTAAVARLEKQGYVRRQRGGTDRRVRTVALTAQGHGIICNAYAEHERDLEAVMAAIPAQDRASARAVLKRVGLAARSRLNVDLAAVPGESAAAD